MSVYLHPEYTAYEEYVDRFNRKQNRGELSRDSEMWKCYRAEFAFLDKYVKAGNQVRKFTNIDQARKRAEKIYKTKKWERLWQSREFSRGSRSPIVEQKIRNTGRGTAGWTNGRRIVLDNKVGLNEYTLLHELAHCLGNMHHGRSFRKTLLSLVGAFMGSDAKKMLRAEFKERKLKFGERREPLEFEKWLEAKQKMEKIREVRTVST